MQTQREFEIEEKISIYLFEYSKITKKIHSNNIQLNQARSKSLNFEQLEFHLKETNSIYYQFQEVIKSKIIELTKN